MKKDKKKTFYGYNLDPKKLYALVLFNREKVSVQFLKPKDIKILIKELVRRKANYYFQVVKKDHMKKVLLKNIESKNMYYIFEQGRFYSVYSPPRIRKGKNIKNLKDEFLVRFDPLRLCPIFKRTQDYKAGTTSLLSKK